MNPRTASVMILVVLTVLLVSASPALPQEWKIYLVGQVDPIVADLYVEDAPWILYHYKDDQSMYVFAIGCNRVHRVERNGGAIALPACPVERLPTRITLVYVALQDLEGKRLDEAFAKLGTLTSTYARAIADANIADATRRRGIEQSLTALKVQLDDATSDVMRNLRRTEVISEAIAAFRDIERRELPPPRYFFAPK